MLRNPNGVLDLIIGVIDTRDRILAESDIYHEFQRTILLVGVISYVMPISYLFLFACFIWHPFILPGASDVSRRLNWEEEEGRGNLKEQYIC